MATSCGEDGSESDDSESFGYIKQEFSPVLSPDTKTVSHVPTFNHTTLGANTGCQQNGKDGALHLPNTRHKKLEIQPGNPLLATTSPTEMLPHMPA
jgi:hypothetical protein